MYFIFHFWHSSTAWIYIHIFHFWKVTPESSLELSQIRKNCLLARQVRNHECKQVRKGVTVKRWSSGRKKSSIRMKVFFHYLNEYLQRKNVYETQTALDLQRAVIYIKIRFFIDKNRFLVSTRRGDVDTYLDLPQVRNYLDPFVCLVY